MSDSPLILLRGLFAPYWLREAKWLHAGRMYAYGQVFVFATVFVAVLRVTLAHTHAVLLGGAIHEDYVSFWSAGRLALASDPGAAYDVARHWAVERAADDGPGYAAFFYPPLFLLLCAPLGVPPFYVSTAVFLGATLFCYWRTLTKLLPGAGTVLLGFPAVAVNLIYGQNGFLTTALFAAGLHMLQRRPALAGICFGCLCYKPHLGLAVPVALLAVRAGRSLLTATVTVVALAGASIAVFGTGTWRAFLAGAPLARHTLEAGLLDNSAWVSVFRAVVQAGCGIEAAYAVQGVVAVLVLATLVVVCRRRPATIAGLLPMAALLTTPFLLVYDLVLLAIPMAWVVAAARRTGFLPWERVTLAAAYVVPLLAPFAARLSVPLGPPVMLALFAVVLRRSALLPR